MAAKEGWEIHHIQDKIRTSRKYRVRSLRTTLKWQQVKPGKYSNQKAADTRKWWRRHEDQKRSQAAMCPRVSVSQAKWEHIVIKKLTNSGTHTVPSYGLASVQEKAWAQHDGWVFTGRKS